MEVEEAIGKIKEMEKQFTETAEKGKEDNPRGSLACFSVAEACRMAIEAMNRQKPKEPFFSIGEWRCPECGGEVVWNLMNPNLGIEKIFSNYCRYLDKTRPAA